LKGDLYEKIAKVVKTIPPFRIRLRADPPGVFTHSKRSTTVWLKPGDYAAEASDDIPISNKSSPTSPLYQLQALLQSEVAECSEDTGPFTPHLSVGQVSGGTNADRLKGEVQAVVEAFQRETHDTTEPKQDEGAAKKRPLDYSSGMLISCVSLNELPSRVNSKPSVRSS
jgi:2'-5' RNA ligase